MAPSRVLILHPALAPYRVDMFNALARRCRLRLVLLSADVANQPFDQERLRAQLVEPPGYLLGGLDVAGRTIRLGIGREIRRFRPDVVVTTEFGQATLAVLAARALGGGLFAHVVGTEDNPSSVRAETYLHGLGRRALQPYLDGLIAYSEEARAMYLERFRATQPVVASPLVQDERVFAGRLERAGGAARAAAARGLMGKRILLYVGRLAPEKRVDRLVDAVGRLQAAWPDLVLALVGDGPERERLGQRAASATAPGRVLFAGRQEGEGLAAWYRLGSVFALASAHEPFGAVVNEALLAGLPVVCSDRAGARVLVAEGRNGARVEADRPEALDAALATWLGRQAPVSSGQLEARRPSLMETTFDDAVDAFLAALEAARGHRAASSGRAAAD